MATQLDLSPFDQKAILAFQTLSQARTQCAVMHDSVSACMLKCLESRELFTSNRAQAPIKQRIAKDEEEKRCVSVCSGKWDEFFRREATRMNQRETAVVQFKAISDMQQRSASA
jgi:hypothetical protein